MLSLRLAVAAAIAAGVQAQGCGFGSGSSNLVLNGDFELNTDQMNSRGYTYLQPANWQSFSATGATRTVNVANGNGPWGGLNSGSGNFYAAMQVAGTGLRQTINNLVVGQLYTISFKSAERPGYSTNERMSVMLGNVRLFPQINPIAAFQTHTTTFNATSTSAVLQFTNDGGGGDQTAFLDAVSICPLSPNCAFVKNPSFEANPHASSHSYIAPSDWTTGSPLRTNMARNGNGPWGGLNSGDGAFYCVLQRQNTYVQQVINGLTQGAPYTLSFLAAERPGYTTAERLGVMVDGSYLPNANALNPFTAFQRYSFTFTPSSTSATIRFVNTGNTNADQSVFIDGVSVCMQSTTPAPTPSTTTVTTTTQVTTHTFDVLSSRMVAQNFASLQNQILDMNRTLNLHLTFPSVSQIVSTLSTGQAQLATRVGGISNAITGALANLPPSSSQPLQGFGQPSISTDPDTGNLIVNGGAAQVNIQGSCGTFDPCTLYRAVDALRQVPA